MPSDIRGQIDTATREQLRGWAQDPLEPNRAVSLLVTIGDDLLARVLADHHRPDLEEAGIGNGRHSFDISLDSRLLPLSGGMLHIRREGDGAELPGSPVRIPPPVSFDLPTRDGVVALLDTPCDDAELQKRITFLATQTERLLQQRATRQGLQDARVADRQHRWGWSSASEAETPLPLRALVIDDTMPVPGRDAGSNAILSHMRSLQRLGYHVTFAPASMVAETMGHLDTIGIEVCHSPWYASVEEVLRRHAGTFDLVYLHRVTIAMSYMTLVRQTMARAMVVYSVADLHHLRLERQAAAENRPELLTLAQRMRTHELFAAWSADVVLTHSSHEAALLRRGLPAGRVHVLPWTIPARPVRIAFGKRHGIAFIGGYAHTPNVDAALWLVKEIMPLVWRHDPTIECLLVGSAMPERLRALAGPGVVPVGRVADLRIVFERIRLTVAPLAYGAGAKGKLLDSFAAGIPCVATPIAIEGLDLPDTLAEWVGTDPEAIAALILRLHTDRAKNVACSKAAVRYVTETLSEDRVDMLMRNAFGHRAPAATAQAVA